MARDQRAAVADIAGALAHPVRVAVVRELGVRADDPPGFTTLRDAVGLGDNGRFNYHLSELRGQLIQRDGDCYCLTPAGWDVATLLRTGHLADPNRQRDLDAATPCHTCGGPLVLACEPTDLTIRCLDCGWADEWTVRLPSAAFDAEPAEARAVVDRTLRTAANRLADGRCPTCVRSVEPRLTAVDTADASLRHRVFADCPGCEPITTTPGLLAFAHDATAGFCHDNGLAPDDRPVWSLEFAVTDHETRIRNRDPWRVEVRPQIGTDELVLLVDENAAVSAVKRHTKFTARDVWYPNRGRS